MHPIIGIDPVAAGKTYSYGIDVVQVDESSDKNALNTVQRVGFAETFVGDATSLDVEGNSGRTEEKMNARRVDVVFTCERPGIFDVGLIVRKGKNDAESSSATQAKSEEYAFGRVRFRKYCEKQTVAGLDVRLVSVDEKKHETKTVVLANGLYSKKQAQATAIPDCPDSPNCLPHVTLAIDIGLEKQDLDEEDRVPLRFAPAELDVEGALSAEKSAFLDGGIVVM